MNKEFFDSQIEKFWKWLVQLYTGKITRQQFLGYMEDIADLVEMEKRKNEAEST